MSLEILYPNGQVMATLGYILVNGVLIPWDGAVTASVSINSIPIQDGVSAAILASVINGIGGGGTKNPLVVTLFDNSGNVISTLPVSLATIPNPSNLDVALSTRASQTTVASILAQLDVALSSRASESTLNSLLGKFNGSTLLGSIDQHGVWTVQPGNTANTTPWLVTSGNGKTIKSVTGSINSATDIVGAVTSKRIKVIAYKLMTVYSTASIAPKFYSNGTGGTLLDQSLLQAPSSVSVGVSDQIAAPSFLFATAAGEKLTLDPNSQAVTYRVTYFDDDAT